MALIHVAPTLDFVAAATAVLSGFGAGSLATGGGAAVTGSVQLLVGSGWLLVKPDVVDAVTDRIRRDASKTLSYGLLVFFGVLLGLGVTRGLGNAGVLSLVVQGVFLVGVAVGSTLGFLSMYYQSVDSEWAALVLSAGTVAALSVFPGIFALLQLFATAFGIGALVVALGPEGS
jgi:hypothetical protein